MRGLRWFVSMQTGPAAGQRMENWLLWTGALELLNIVLFTLLWGMVVLLYPHAWGVLAGVGWFTFAAVMFQGALYWLLKWRRFFTRSAPATLLRFLRGAYAFNSILLLLFPLLAGIRLLSSAPLGGREFLQGLGYYLFGLGEFIHYFVYKINMRSAEMREMLHSRRPVPARFRRELARAHRRALRAEST